MNFNEKGSVDWFIQEVKKQQSTDDDGRYLGSVEVANKHLGLLIVYNGLPSKDANKPETTIEFFNKSTLTIQQISSNGQSSLEPLTTIPELPILPFTSRKLQNGATYILSEINGKASIVLLKP
jgi:hypothetical protein